MWSQHKAGKLKQTNKKHKGVVGSKRAQKRALGAGRVEGSSSVGKKESRSGEQQKNCRLNRLNHAQQMKKNKKDQIWLQKRVGSTNGPPRTVALIPLSETADPSEALASLISDAVWSSHSAEDILQHLSNGSLPTVYANYNQFKARFAFIQARLDLLSILETAKVADILVFLVDARSLEGGNYDDVVSASGRTALSALLAQGCPEAFCCVQHMEVFSGKLLIDRRKVIRKQLEVAVSSDVKVVEGATAVNLCRQMVSVNMKDIGWRSVRSYMLGDNIIVSDLPAEAPLEDGTLSGRRIRLSGYLRGRPLPVNSLMHISGVGTGRIASIHCNPTLQPGGVRNPKGIEGLTINADPAKHESLVIEAAGDGISGEQTWPTEAEMNSMGDITEAQDRAAGRSRRVVPTHIPEGMSSYQADWFVDEEGAFDVSEVPGDGEDDEEEKEEEVRVKKKGEMNALVAMESKPAAPQADNTVEDNESDVEVEVEEDFDMGGSSLLQEPTGVGAINEKRRLRAMAKEDADFPDEMDTPMDVPARLRFARYRALQSFRSSPWHPKENLPQDYAKVFQFENFGAMQRRVVAYGGWLASRQNTQQSLEHIGNKNKNKKSNNGSTKDKNNRSTSGSIGSMMEIADEENEEDQEDDVEEAAEEMSMQSGSAMHASTELSGYLVPDTTDVVASGHYVVIEIDCIPNAERAMHLFRHSGYLAVFALLPHENKLSVLHCNVQRTAAYDEPIKSKDELVFQVGFRQFSSRPVFSQSNLNCDKHKMERFWVSGTFSVATVFGPVSFLPSPVLVFKRLPDGCLILVGHGSLMSADPDRIILKKVILTGHPIRVRKKFAVVKHMFYDPQDVRWFKPAELATKHGLRGHIKEPVGTHGLFKAHFSGPINQNDTVMLTLYKRIFPKFPSAGKIEIC